MSRREAIKRIVFVHLWWVCPLIGGSWIAYTAPDYGLFLWEVHAILGALIAATGAYGGGLQIWKILRGDVRVP